MVKQSDQHFDEKLIRFRKIYISYEMHTTYMNEHVYSRDENIENDRFTDTKSLIKIIILIVIQL